MTTTDFIDDNVTNTMITTDNTEYTTVADAQADASPILANSFVLVARQSTRIALVFGVPSCKCKNRQRHDSKQN